MANHRAWDFRIQWSHLCKSCAFRPRALGLTAIFRRSLVAKCMEEERLLPNSCWKTI